jgi:deoxyribodipyrimidine photo-lyase
MGRPFLEKFADVQWEINEDHLQLWKDGKTGYPIVDAAMRACKVRGWMENRVRMVAACFLVKDLMLDWRESIFLSRRNLLDWDIELISRTGREILYGELYRWGLGF